MVDVLIIGSGGAGLSAALSAKKNGSNVLVVSKTYPTHSQTVQAQGGINGVLYEADDSVQTHIDDTYKASYNLSKKENTEYLCKNAKDTILWLDSIGVPFNRDENHNISQRKFGGTKQIRTCYSSDYTGLKIVHTLFDQCIKEELEFKNEYFLLELIVENGICFGAVFIDIKSGNIEKILAKTTILATGGYAGIYLNNTTNSYSNNGDGIVAALKAGAKLSNMEFVQFHPTTLATNSILISESARGEGAYLVDENGNRFIDELSTRDEISKAIYEKSLKNEKVYLDFRHLGLEKINKLIPQERKLALEFSNVKIENELLEIKPSAHYTMGGISVDIDCQSSISNLYACGECAEASIHGANRLGGNSLLEITVLGQKAGLNASSKAKMIASKEDKYDITNIKMYIETIFDKENSINLYHIKDELSTNLFKNLGLFRDEEKINEMISLVDEIEKEFSKIGISDKSKIYNKNLIDYIELKNSLELSKIISLCAKQRKESRGSHYRIDHPMIDDSYSKSSYVEYKESKYTIDFEDLI